ncbi:MAG: hypothetical protein COA83_09870 [Methylophaga sp.]|nr:MAG: hypothetical protein COA83_09870 [Methylophaga sp.]
MTEQEQNQADELDAVTKMEDQTEPLTGEWEPSEASSSMSDDMMSTKDAVALIMASLSGIATRVRGEHWAFEPAAIDEVAGINASAIERATGKQKMPWWMELVIANGMLFAPAIIGELKLREVERAAKEQGEEKEQTQEKGIDGAD